jgi:hypothetical protein
MEGIEAILKAPITRISASKSHTSILRLLVSFNAHNSSSSLFLVRSLGPCMPVSYTVRGLLVYVLAYAMVQPVGDYGIAAWRPLRDSTYLFVQLLFKALKKPKCTKDCTAGQCCSGKILSGDAKNFTTLFGKLRFLTTFFRTGTHITHKFPSFTFSHLHRVKSGGGGPL